MIEVVNTDISDKKNEIHTNIMKTWEESEATKKKNGKQRGQKKRET